MKQYALIVYLKEACVGDRVETNGPYAKMADIYYFVCIQIIKPY